MNFIIITFLVASPFPNQSELQQHKADTASHYKTAQPQLESIVRLDSGSAVGMGMINSPKFLGYRATGFAITKDHIMTVGHFCNDVFMKQKSSFVNVVGIVDHAIKRFNRPAIISLDKVDGKNDVCILTMQSHGIRPIDFIKDFSSIYPDQIVSTTGAPGGFFPVTQYGTVIDVSLNRIVNTVKADYTEKFALNLNIRPGASGSPVFDSSGKVIGMIQAHIGDISGGLGKTGGGMSIDLSFISFAVPSDVLQKSFEAMFNTAQPSVE